MCSCHRQRGRWQQKVTDSQLENEWLVQQRGAMIGQRSSWRRGVASVYPSSGMSKMLLLAALLITLERDTFYQCCQSESCNKTYRSFISVVLALLGIAFSGYNVIISTLGLVQGPFCNTPAGWGYIFKDTAGGYLIAYSSWSQCTEPVHVVEWNIILFSILIALSGLQVIICFLKVMAELKQILCGTYSVFIQPGII
ncbi:transmembrane 4 L6 family member 18 isoform X3 [Caretta caretta]|uniref:transmembrane 4 L6 family member 18 isoform X3 n=1 Tax=Caretta caretta TaxID=8467 RepID=UPI003F4B4666